MKKAVSKKRLKKINWKRLNTLLSVVVFVLAVYIIAIPFLPEVELLINRRQDSTKGFVYKSDLAKKAGIDENELKPIPKDNRIVIPQIEVDSSILEGGDIDILSNGETWRRPNTSNPLKGGNTVVVAHRFFGRGKNTFYHLNKLKVNDEIIIFWEGKEFNYKIEKVFETTPDNLSVEKNTGDDRLTLYTCSGMSAENRLVVIAKPI